MSFKKRFKRRRGASTAKVRSPLGLSLDSGTRKAPPGGLRLPGGSYGANVSDKQAGTRASFFKLILKHTESRC